MALLIDVNTTPTFIPVGIASSPVVPLENPTPLGSGPSVTVYLDYNANVTTGNAAYSIAAGGSLSLPVNGRALYAISSQIGLLLVHVKA